MEVDVTRSSLNRMGIYAALNIAEVWRYKGKRIRVYELAQEGTYDEVHKSPSFSYLDMGKVNEFLQIAATVDETSLMRDFAAWARKEILPLVEGKPPRNGKRSACKETDK